VLENVRQIGGVYPPPMFFAKSAESHEKKGDVILYSTKECARM
jgi:hypothetical protein